MSLALGGLDEPEDCFTVLSHSRVLNPFQLAAQLGDEHRDLALVEQSVAEAIDKAKAARFRICVARREALCSAVRVVKLREHLTCSVSTRTSIPIVSSVSTAPIEISVACHRPLSGTKPPLRHSSPSAMMSKSSS